MKYVGLVQGCDWFRVYDLAEAFHESLGRQSTGGICSTVERPFEDQGIGWQMIGGQLVTRGDAEFERVVAQAAEHVEAAGLRTARTEIEEARADLSRRPEPDVTGTIQHCMAALECVARVVSNDERATLGEIIQRHGLEIGIPKPMDSAIDRMWGYASEMGRHIREGRIPMREEAELLLSVSASVITYLLQRRAGN